MISRDDRWRIVRPRSTHFKPATCERAGCEKFYLGWHVKRRVDIPEEMAGIELIRNSKMEYVETWVDETTIDFWFAPEQECFDGQAGRHLTNLERDPIYKLNGLQLEPNQWTDRIQERFYQLGRS